MDDRVLEDIARATSLREGPAGVRSLLLAVRQSDGIRLADAARAVRLPLPVASAVRRELEKRGILKRERGLRFSREGLEWATESLGLGAALKFDVPLAPQETLASPLDAVVTVLDSYLQRAPPVDVTLDQTPCTAETAVRRAALLYRSGALEGRRVLILGDDDSVSLAIGILGKRVAGRALTRRLAVLEIDPQRAAFLEQSAEEESIPLEVVQADLRQPLPTAFEGAFDCFETDPPYTLPGAELFLTRGIQALERGRGTGMFSFGHSAPSDRLALQRRMSALGLAVTALHPDFNRYAGAAILGSISELYELVSTGGQMAVDSWHGPIYTADLNPGRLVRVCRRCGHRTVLGKGGEPDTIAELEARGCEICGGSIFTRARGPRTED